LLWDEPLLRGQIESVIALPAGARLVSQAFARDPDKLRALNRWIYQQRLEQSLRRIRAW
jgi:hypothetical protein